MQALPSAPGLLRRSGKSSPEIQEEGGDGMTDKLGLLKVALEKQNYDLAAHVLVYGMVKSRVDASNGGKRRKRRRPK